MKKSACPQQSEKKWLKVTMRCPEPLAEPVADMLGRLSGSGVELRPAEQEVDVIGYFPGEEAATPAVEAEITGTMEKMFLATGHVFARPRFELMPEEDWSVTWKQFFMPHEIVPGLIIKPSWENYTPRPGDLILELDPGMAFGTGQHASTQMALALVQRAFSDTPGEIAKVLDVGTGTGILAMGAALFGATSVIAIDNDPEAVSAAVDNVAVNALGGKVEVSGTDLADIRGSFELISANIVHDVLVEMAPQFTELLAAGGRVVLAGILSGEQEKNIVAVYTGLGLHLQRIEYKEEWAALLFAA